MNVYTVCNSTGTLTYVEADWVECLEHECCTVCSRTGTLIYVEADWVEYLEHECCTVCSRYWDTYVEADWVEYLEHECCTVSGCTVAWSHHSLYHVSLHLAIIA